MRRSIRTGLKRRYPRMWHTLRTAKQGVKLFPRLFGYYPRHCNICGYRGRFLAEIHFPDIFTYDAICPNCGSLPRNRLIALAMESESLVGRSDRLLHFAPEDPVHQMVSGRVGEYVTTDLNPAVAQVAANIEQLPFEDCAWDAIICSHVLEHVDHRKALAELYRVLAPGGRLLALFPVVEGWSDHYENAEVRSGRDRAIHFGKDNHRRRFGRSVRQEIRDAGFALEEFSPPGRTVVEFGLIPGEVLFIAHKLTAPT